MAEEVVECDDRNGVSFKTAIEKRYLERCAEVPKEVLTLPQNEGKDRTIELVGFDKTFERLLEVNVSHQNISYCGHDCQPLKRVLNYTKTLILSNNLLTEWSEVAKIVAITQCLTGLVLSYNKIKVPESVDLEAFKAIKTLIIDNIDYDWKDVLFCAQMWPNIERLDVWGNRITALKAPEPHLFTHLNYLSICNNNIEDWTQVCKLGALPQLKTLNVSDCRLNGIRFDDSDLNEKSKLFAQLECLLISNNQLSVWRDVAELNKLLKLDNLLIRNNPVFDSAKYDINFNLILSRIANLKVLNKEKISDSMRRDAEIGYLRKTFKEYKTIKTSNNEKLLQFLSNNPRFESILSEFGKPLGLENISKAEIDRKKFLTINIRNPFDEQSIIEKKIPASISIINFKTIVRKLFDIDYNYDINLLWTSKNFKCPLDKESQNLNYYSIENGDTIVVNVQ